MDEELEMRRALVSVAAAVIGMLSVVGFAKEYSIPLLIPDGSNQVFKDKCSGSGSSVYHCDLTGSRIAVTEPIKIDELKAEAPIAVVINPGKSNLTKVTLDGANASVVSTSGTYGGMGLAINPDSLAATELNINNSSFLVRIAGGYDGGVNAYGIFALENTLIRQPEHLSKTLPEGQVAVADLSHSTTLSNVKLQVTAISSRDVSSYGGLFERAVLQGNNLITSVAETTSRDGYGGAIAYGVSEYRGGGYLYGMAAPQYAASLGISGDSTINAIALGRAWAYDIAYIYDRVYVEATGVSSERIMVHPEGKAVINAIAVLKSVGSPIPVPAPVKEKAEVIGIETAAGSEHSGLATKVNSVINAASFIGVDYLFVPAKAIGVNANAINLSSGSKLVVNAIAVSGGAGAAEASGIRVYSGMVSEASELTVRAIADGINDAIYKAIRAGGVIGGSRQSIALSAGDGEPITINQSGTGKVRLTGDLNAGGNGAMAINFSTSDSYFRGLPHLSGSQDNLRDDPQYDSRYDLTFSNGAVCQPTIYGTVVRDGMETLLVDGNQVKVKVDGGKLDLAWANNFYLDTDYVRAVAEQLKNDPRTTVDDSKLFRPHASPAALGSNERPVRKWDITGATSNNATFRINTDLAKGKSDFVGLSDSTVTGKQKIQIAYDPSWEQSVVEAAEKIPFFGVADELPQPKKNLQLAKGKTALGVEPLSFEVVGEPSVMDYPASNELRYVYSTPIMVADEFGGGLSYYLTGATFQSVKSMTAETIADHYQGQQNLLIADALSISERLNSDLRELSKRDQGGLWARVRHSSLDQDRIEQDYNGFQVGLDYLAGKIGDGNFYLGVYADHLDASSDYQHGHDDTKAYGGGVYASWISEVGHKLDLTLKLNRFESECYSQEWKPGYYGSVLEQVTGDYRVWNKGIGLDYAYEWLFARSYSLEPMIGIAIAHLNHVNYELSNGVKVAQSSQNPVLGKCGLLGSKHFSKGSLYLQGMLYHNFTGDRTVTSSIRDDQVSSELEGHTTWGSVGLGASASIVSSGYVYFDVNHDLGGHALRDWQVNLGFRWSF